MLSKDYVYTWHIWQHWCNIATYRLQLSSFFGVDLCNFSEGQPMQIMAKDSKVSKGHEQAGVVGLAYMNMELCSTAQHGSAGYVVWLVQCYSEGQPMAQSSCMQAQPWSMLGRGNKRGHSRALLPSSLLTAPAI